MIQPSYPGLSLVTSWIYYYDPETKQQSSKWKGPNSLRLKKGETGEEQSQEHAHNFL
jgi:hypothetical protein